MNKGECLVEKNTLREIFEAVLENEFSHLVGRYGTELVNTVWDEIRMAGGDEAYFSVCGWKNEMSLPEALECLFDYCDFIEVMIRKYSDKEKERSFILESSSRTI